jgi:hypothetical protein
MQFTFSVTVSVPEDASAGDVGLAMADQLDAVTAEHPEWTFGPFVLESVS